MFCLVVVAQGDSMDKAWETVLTTPIWAAFLGVLVLVIGNLMNVKTRWHNLMLIVAWSLFVTAIYATPPLSTQTLPVRSGWTVVGAILAGILAYRFCWWSLPKQGSPEETVYRKTVDAYRKNRFALSVFYDAGGFDLSPKSLVAVCKRLKRVGVDVFLSVPNRQWRKFAERLVAVGRPLHTPEAANAALIEWAQTKTLRAPWEPGGPELASHRAADEDNPLLVALEELDAIYTEGDNLATRFQCKGAKLPSFGEAVAWNDKAVVCAKRQVFSAHISIQDWATFKEDWSFADCQRIERVLREHGCLNETTDTQCAIFRYLWGRVKRLGELIAKIKGQNQDENKTPIESLTDLLLKIHSLLDVVANLARPIPMAEQHDLFINIRQFLRKTAPEYVDRFNEIVSTPPPKRMVDFPEEFTVGDMEEWSRSRSEPCDRLHAIAAYLARIISDLRSKLPS